MQARSKFIEKIEELRKQTPINEVDYYCVTLLGTKDGKIKRFCQSEFRGFTKTKPQRELRAGRLVDPVKMLNNFREIEEPAVVVNTTNDLFLFFLIGGHAMIEKSLGDKYFLDLIEEQETVFSHTKGYLFTRDAPKEAIQHAPSRKMRMKIIKRDNYCCKVCGRSPKNHVDIELHVHHMHPWGRGGVTEEENLITLCGTCHDGLDPHFDLDLFPLVGINPFIDIIKGRLDYKRGMYNYMKISLKAYKEISNKK